MNYETVGILFAVGDCNVCVHMASTCEEINHDVPNLMAVGMRACLCLCFTHHTCQLMMPVLHIDRN